MFTPSRYIRNCFLIVTLATLAGCIEEDSLLAPDAPASFGRGAGGRAPVVEEFDVWDMTAWIATDHPLGRGVFESKNVSHSKFLGDRRSGALVLTLGAREHFLHGAEIRSASPVRFRDVEINLKTPNAPGSISAFFLFQLVQRPRNDEIDIEILNGTRQILFTTWVGGNETNHVERTLGFDPWKNFHDYRIEWSPSRVRFLVDGISVEEFTRGIPRQAMYVMSNTWWPTWLPREGEPSDKNGDPITLKKDEVHIIDRIVY